MDAMTLPRVDTSWIEAIPEMDDKQTGALRRVLNLSRQLPGDWSGMMGQTVVGEDFGAFRFQLAYMSYALALAHTHRLPAAPGVFKQPLRKLIEKILMPDCWMYWSYVSTGNGVYNKHLGPLTQKWDPVASENIMYSAYVQSMALLYHYMFRDDKYAQPGALTFRLKTRFWNEGGFTFPYDERQLNDLIYWQMAEQGYLGVACEPDCIFQICNQPNIIGFRMNDLVYGGQLAQEATQGYVDAWKEFGMLDADGNFNTMVQISKHSTLTTNAPNMNFWLMSLLHSWYPEIVRQQYSTLMRRHLLEGPDNTRWIRPMSGLGESEEVQLTAQDMSWAACLASEVGDTETLEGLFAYADRFMNPVWEDGAYYYKRRDENFDADGLFTGMDPASGNAMFNYARLNVENGLKMLYDGPFDDKHFAQPALTDVPAEVDVRRAWFSQEHDALVITIDATRSLNRIELGVSLPDGRGLPMIVCDGESLSKDDVRLTGDRLAVTIEPSSRATLVFQW